MRRRRSLPFHTTHSAENGANQDRTTKEQSEKDYLIALPSLDDGNVVSQAMIFSGPYKNNARHTVNTST